jgi:DNA-binding response OmpR family regulator
MSQHDTHILCVDDEKPILDLLRVSLNRLGYTCETAQNGFAALERIRQNQHRFRVIITDIRMPGLDGFGLIEQSRLAGYSGPFIVYAGVNSADDRDRFRELGVAHVITKPARPGELSAALRALVAAA